MPREAVIAHQHLIGSTLPFANQPGSGLQFGTSAYPGRSVLFELLGNRAEVSHQPTRWRERQMKRFKSARHAQRFLSAHSRIHNHFQLRRHHLSANQYRAARENALRTWRDVAEVASAA